MEVLIGFENMAFPIPLAPSYRGFCFFFPSSKDNDDEAFLFFLAHEETTLPFFPF